MKGIYIKLHIISRPHMKGLYKYDLLYYNHTLSNQKDIKTGSLNF